MEDYIATEEWAKIRGLEFTGVFVNVAPEGHRNRFMVMCVDNYGVAYGFFFDSSGTLYYYDIFGFFW
jgi:lipoprotein signal peptidase